MTSCKKIIIIWIIIIALVIVLFGQENNETEKITENYLSACGGSALAEINTEIRKGTMLRGVSGKIPVKIIAKSPGKWRFHLTFAWGDRVCYGFDGSATWIQVVESGPAGLSPTYCYCSTGYVKEGFERRIGKAVKVELLDSLKMGGKDCIFKLTIYP